MKPFLPLSLPPSLPSFLLSPPSPILHSYFYNQKRKDSAAAIPGSYGVLDQVSEDQSPPSNCRNLSMG